MIKKVNLPNRLTLHRFTISVAFLVALMNYDHINWLITSLCLFVAAAMTDLYDGLLARRIDEETDFGRFMDPLADKLITMVAFVYFVEIPELHWPAWLVVCLVGRELAVNSLRTLGANREKVLSSTTSGKYKTAFQMTGIALVLLGLIFYRSGVVAYQWLSGVSWTTMFLILLMTIYSGFEYYWRNWPMLWLSSVHSS
jgi:CDP-diacylglycerol--glycerol-3-phosphate 3-phosphatidyltransferase